MLNILKIKTLIDARGKKEYLVATFSMFIASIIEALGIGFIVPLINFLNGNPNLISNLFPNINSQNNSIVFFSGIFIIICFIVKSLILTFNSYQYFQFSYRLQTDISKKIFQKYLESADIFLDKNKMIANIYNECEKLTHLVIIPLTVITAEITIVILLFLILVFNSLNLTFLALIIFSISYYLYNNFTKIYINKIGKLREYSDFRKISELQKSLSQLIEIRLYNVIGLRVMEYENYAITSSNSNAMNGVISGLPRIFMETLVVIIVIFYFHLYLFFYKKMGSPSLIIPTFLPTSPSESTSYRIPFSSLVA
jgi:ABC-type multidrug transport system fused ATPase/permease subunit